VFDALIIVFGVHSGYFAVDCLQACHARISAPKAQLGLPELSLGVIPGFGGVARFSLSKSCFPHFFREMVDVWRFGVE